MNQFGPYTPIIKAGTSYYVSGQVGVDPSTKTCVADITSQTRQVMANMKDVLSTVGLDMSNVVKTTVFLADMGDFAAMNDEYVIHFDEPRPARSTVAVKELPRLADTLLLVEVEAVAYRSLSGGNQYVV